ncbi:MAG: metallopeptidase family protein [Rhodospirillales bacterium]|nr:metallopeptidase family protein [Rhodospirillales bacterium]
MDRQQIIMNFTVPPSIEDVEIITRTALENLPEELMEFCDGLALKVEDIADEITQTEQDIDDPFDLIALFCNGSQISPGVQSKVANDDDIIIIYRRPLLDLWCESGEDLNVLVRQALIDELGANFDFSEDEIEEMSRRHFQGML